MPRRKTVALVAFAALLAPLPLHAQDTTPGQNVAPVPPAPRLDGTEPPVSEQPAPEQGIDAAAPKTAPQEPEPDRSEPDRSEADKAETGAAAGDQKTGESADPSAEPEAERSGKAKPLSDNPLAAISPEIAMLRVIGPWSDGERKGFSRIIATTSGGTLKLYVQWIDQAGEVAETAELENAAQTPQLALAEIRVDAGDEDSSVYFDTPPDAQGFRETFVLIIERPGEARLGPAMN